MTITINEHPPKFCKDCKYYEKSEIGRRYDKCYQDGTLRYDHIRGESWTSHGYCDLKRALAGPCGPKGKLFVPLVEEKVLDKIPEKCYTGIVERVVRWFKK